MDLANGLFSVRLACDVDGHLYQDQSYADLAGARTEENQRKPSADEQL